MLIKKNRKVLDMRINSKIAVTVLVLLWATAYNALSQNNYALFKKLSETDTPYERLIIYNLLGNNLKHAYPDSAMGFYKKSLKISIAEGNNILKANTIGLIGSVWAVKNRYDSAYYYINRSIKLNKKIKNESGVALALNSLGLVELQKENRVKAKKQFLLATNMSLKLNDSVLISLSYNNLGLLYKRNHNYDSALYYYHESLKIRERLGDSWGIGSTTNNIAIIYEKISNFELALKYLRRSLIIRQQNENIYGEAVVNINYGLVYESRGELSLALKHYKKSLVVMTKLNKSSKIALLHNNIGSVYVNLKNFKSGFEHLQKGLIINKELGDISGQINSILELAEFFEKLKIYQNAINHYQEALALSKYIDDIALNSVIYEGLYNSYELFSRFDSALLYYKKYAMLNDSIFNTYSKRNIEKLEIEYQSLKKEKQNQDLIRQNQIKEENLKRLLLVGAMLLVVLASIIVFGFFFVKSKNKLEKTYQLVLDQRNSIQTQSYELNSAYKKLQEFSTFKEQLTNMIVHDLKNPLNTILNVAQINSYPDKEKVIFQSGKQMLNLVMNILDVYKYEGKSFMPECKEQFVNALIYKIKADMSFVLSEKSIKIKTELDYDYKVNIDSESFERIIVNLLTNAIKFSDQGSMIIISTEPIKNNRFRLHVIDKGVGIASKNIDEIFMKFEQREKRKLGYSESTGIGLTYCKMAIEAQGGNIGVTSEVGKGSDFYIELNYLETKTSDIVEDDDKENYLLLSRENRNILQPHIKILQKKDIFEVTEIRNILKLINRENKELQEFCSQIEGSVLNCNQQMFNELIELALGKI